MTDQREITAKSFRLPARTIEQLAEIKRATSYTDTQTLILAIDRLHREIIQQSEQPPVE